MYSPIHDLNELANEPRQNTVGLLIEAFFTMNSFVGLFINPLFCTRMWQRTDLAYALVRNGELEALKRLNLRDVDCYAHDRKTGHTLLVACVRLVNQRPSRRDEILSTIEWLVRCGANPCQASTSRRHVANEIVADRRRFLDA